MNSKGPKIEPCGTPDVSELYPENDSETEVLDMPDQKLFYSR